MGMGGVRTKGPKKNEPARLRRAERLYALGPMAGKACFTKP